LAIGAAFTEQVEDPANQKIFQEVEEAHEPASYTLPVRRARAGSFEDLAQAVREALRRCIAKLQARASGVDQAPELLNLSLQLVAFPLRPPEGAP
jgi:hypothetical protein